MSRRVRWVVGLALVAIGVAVIAGALLRERSTADEFDAAQEQLAEAWDAPLIVPPSSNAPSGAEVATASPLSESPSPSSNPPLTGTASPTESTQASVAADPVFTPNPLAVLSFRRPGSDRAPVTDRRLLVVDDITEQDLRAGPGHYPTTAEPGARGNFAVAGHRTGWGAPFFRLDELKVGDEVVVTDRAGRKHVYVIDRIEVVAPDDAWVLGPDPIGTGEPTLTLTTCDPAGVNTHRLVVFGTLN